MADFTVKKHKAFTVKVEGVKDEFKLPALDDLPIELVGVFSDVSSKADIVTQAKESAKFILDICPELEGKVSEFDLIQIFNAYFANQSGAAGES